MLLNKENRISLFSFGSISFASFVIAAFTGVFLAIPYDIRNPYDSISLLLLTNPAGALIRSLHYWSAQVFLITTVLHIWDHLRSSSEKRVKNGVWLRLSVSVFVTFFVMLSGFILKGDAESIQAKEIFRSMLEGIPLADKTLAYSVLGFKNDYQIIYVQHIAAATVFLWLVIAEHAKSVWPKLKTVVSILPLLFILSFAWPPLLHDNYNPLIKGPWYFQGLQEIFHWVSYPQYVIIFLLFLLILFYYLPKLENIFSIRVKKFFLSAGLAYILMCIFAIFFRGENWKFILPWKDKITAGSDVNPFSSALSFFNNEPEVKNIPIVMGRREGCLYCHSGVKGLSASHNPESMGCFSCHLGNPFSLDKRLAHNGMILIPGSLETAKLTCGSQNCHSDIPGRVNNSIMNTMSGVVSVDKYVFGEISFPAGQFNIKNLDNSAADNHLRNLCASCHTGGRKENYGPITELSRGGGCNACHLAYTKPALDSLLKYLTEKNSGNVKISTLLHPDLTVKVTDNKCFGCHSRSGRISTNYEGWHETQFSPQTVKGKTGFRLLEDGRVFTKVQPDIHFEQGMECIDCHISKEIMGDGQTYSHKEEQVIIKCLDCHTKNFNVAENFKPDPESEKLLLLRKYTLPENSKIICTEFKGLALLNARADNSGKGILQTKNSGKILLLKPPAKECTASKAHERLACTACHSSWAPQCTGCHTEYKPGQTGYDLLYEREVKGSWVENPGDFLAEPPVLGVKIIGEKDGTKKEVIDNFVPGMVLSIDKSGFENNISKKGTMFRRLYAPAFSHTIVRKSRSCISCHVNPLALGYGRGELKYEIKGSAGKWLFKPQYKLSSEDNLPEDAWTGFLIERKGQSSTRPGARPFNLEEQKKILTAGACFSCHAPESFFIKKYLTDKGKTVLSKKCILPLW